MVCLSHPLKMSLLYINYNPSTKLTYVECRLFSDDFKLAIEEEMLPKVPINFANMSLEQKTTINNFINKHIKVIIGNVKLDLEFYDFIYNHFNNTLTLKYEYPSIKYNKGEKVVLTNSLLFKQFELAQINIFELDIPRVAKTTIRCFKDDYTETFTIQ